MPNKRITVSIPEDLEKRMLKTIRRGFRDPLISAVLNLLVEALKRDGEIIVGAVLSGQYKLVFDPTKEPEDAEAGALAD